MDHMRLSGIEPSSVILSQRNKLKRLKNNVPKVPKEAKAKRDITRYHKLCQTFGKFLRS